MRQFQIEQSQERQLVQMAKSFDYHLDDEDEREEAVEATVAVLRIHKQLHGAAWDMGQLLREQKACPQTAHPSLQRSALLRSSPNAVQRPACAK